MNYIEQAAIHISELYPNLIYAQPRIDQLPKGAIIGTWCYSIPNVARIVLNRKMEVAPGVMPSDVTRAWIKDAYNLPIKLRKAQIDAKCYPLPLHAKRGEYKDCAYVDIKGAYLTILKLGYNLEYERNKYIGVNFSTIPQEIAANKMSYAIAVSMSKSKLTNISVMGETGYYTRRNFNVFSNPCLYNLASDTLSAIASEALRIFGDRIHYVNTDGFIIDHSLSQALIDLIASWGFDARIKYEGKTSIFGVAAWRVGDNRTRRLDPNALDFTSELPDKFDSLWLKRRLQIMNNCAKMT